MKRICSLCEYKSFWKGNGSPNRYYCRHPKVISGFGSKRISTCNRGSTELKIKTSPQWCPFREVRKYDAMCQIFRSQKYRKK